jgi:3-oxoacyl-[acyl-carrier-protein] synthase-3
MNKITAAITAVGAYVPDFVLTNQILETLVDTNDEWITARTGIKERRILKDNTLGTSFLAINAALDLIKKASINPVSYTHLTLPTTYC